MYHFHSPFKCLEKHRTTAYSFNLRLFTFRELLQVKKQAAKLNHDVKIVLLVFCCLTISVTSPVCLNFHHSSLCEFPN